MFRKVVVCLIAAWGLSHAAFSQTGEVMPSFEVASVKPTVLDPAKLMAGQQKVGVTFDAARVDFGALSMADLLRTAFQVKSYQVSGPEWIESERYDIQAKLPEGSKRSQLPQMLQSLLIERFGLQYHKTKREVGGYSLVVAKGGAKLKESAPDPPAEDGVPAPGAGTLRSGASLDNRGVVTNTGPNGNSRQTTGPNGMHLDIDHMTMAALADTVGRFVEGPVSDETGLKSKYDFVLDLSREELVELARRSGQAVARPEGGPPTVASDPNQVSLRNSLDLLGLKLEPKKVSADVVVIDRLERVPKEN